MGLFDQSKSWLVTEEMFALYRAVHEISGDPAIGLKLGSEQRPSPGCFDKSHGSFRSQVLRSWRAWRRTLERRLSNLRPTTWVRSRAGPQPLPCRETGIRKSWSD
jgi:hypothetical protein